MPAADGPNESDAGSTRPLLTALLELEGTHACAESGCPSRRGVRCEYADRRNRSCTSAWCTRHRLVVDGRVLCRRHAAVVNALPARATGSLPPLPDRDDRAPSLAGWMARELDAPVRELLAALLRVRPDEVSSSQVMLSLVGPQRRRAWERAWHARPDGGDAGIRVAIVAEESGDGEVALHVDGEECARMTPPWIGSRDVGAGDPRRAAFNAALLSALEARLRGGGTAVTVS